MQAQKGGVVRQIVIADAKETHGSTPVAHTQSRPMGIMASVTRQAARLPGVSALFSLLQIGSQQPAKAASSSDKDREFSVSASDDSTKMDSVAAKKFREPTESKSDKAESKSEEADTSDDEGDDKIQLELTGKFSAAEFVEMVTKKRDVQNISIGDVSLKNQQFDDTYLTKLPPLLKLEMLDINCAGEHFTAESILSLRQHPKLSFLILRNGVGTQELCRAFSLLPVTKLLLTKFKGLDDKVTEMIPFEQLDMLALNSSEITENTLRMIGERARRLQCLWLWDCACVDDKTATLLNGCRNLRYLIIRECPKLSEEGLAGLLKFPELKLLETDFLEEEFVDRALPLGKTGFSFKNIPQSILEEGRKRGIKFTDSQTDMDEWISKSTSDG